MHEHLEDHVTGRSDSAEESISNPLVPTEDTDPEQPALVRDTKGEPLLVREPDNAVRGPREYNISNTFADEDTPVFLSELNATPLTRGNIDGLPDELVRCGCGECGPPVSHPGGNRTDLTPFLADDDASDVFLNLNWDPREKCQSPRAATISEAEATYRHFIGGRHAKGLPSKVSRASDRYSRIHDVDRHLQQEFDLTTVLISLRLSPPNSERRYRPPLELVEDLHGGYEECVSPLSLLRKQLPWPAEDHHLISVTAGTEHLGTPHTHIYVWLDDPQDEVESLHFNMVLSRHVETTPSASGINHQYDPAGAEGAVTVQHDPPTVVDMTAIDEALGNSTPQQHGAVTKGCKYVASQLPHLAPLGRESPADHRAAAYAWASSSRWGPNLGGLPDPSLGE